MKSVAFPIRRTHSTHRADPTLRTGPPLQLHGFLPRAEVCHG